MPKYKGKYKKSRSCIHAEQPLMFMVIVKDTCPKKVKFSSAYMVDKPTCEECECHEPKE
ncbi:MAG: hypothetical protein AWM53_02014 [Candidatus Dichloromethanomonas elyunquensis]|nr:MAG: hypothetical protein AWM53_02014 [Candidatus Dichloromethanomonas elyunquensis]